MQAEDVGQTIERQRLAPVAWDYVDRWPGGLSVRVDRIILAAHEAGHAVVGHYVGNRIPADLHVFIQEGAGTAQLRGGAHQAQLVATLAGRAGEAVLLPDLEPTSWSDEHLQQLAEVTAGGWRRFLETGSEIQAETDDEIAMTLIVSSNSGIAADQALSLFRKAEDEAIRIASIPTVRTAIQSVMLALIHRERLSGLEVERLIVSSGSAIENISEKQLHEL